MHFSTIEHSICHILGMVSLVDVKQKVNEWTGCYASKGTFDLECSRSNYISGMGLQGQIWNLLYLSQKWFDCHETKNKHINWTLCLKWDHQVWPWPWSWPLNFQCQILNLLHLSQKWCDWHEMKSKYINWNLGLKWDQWVWPWPWPWPVKYGICYISAKNGLIATKQKANISIELQASNVTMTLKGEVWGSNL